MHAKSLIERSYAIMLKQKAASTDDSIKSQPLIVESKTNKFQSLSTPFIQPLHSMVVCTKRLKRLFPSCISFDPTLQQEQEHWGTRTKKRQRQIGTRFKITRAEMLFLFIWFRSIHAIISK